MNHLNALSNRVEYDGEELYEMALRVNCDAGSLKECEYHEAIYFDGGSDVQDAYKIANARITAGEIDLPDGVSRRDFTDVIKQAYEENSGLDGCSLCDKWMRDD